MSGRAASEPIAGIVGYSGLLLAAGEARGHEKRHTPPILLVHGEADEMIPAMALGAAASGLGKAGFEVEWHIRPGLGHGIDPEGLELGGAFLARVLGKGRAACRFLISPPSSADLSPGRAPEIAKRERNPGMSEERFPYELVSHWRVPGDDR